MNNKKDNIVEVQFKRKNTRFIVGAVVGILVIAIIILLTCFHIDEIDVTGNVHYSEEEIKDYVLGEGYIDNSVLLMLKNKIHPIKDIPFIAKMDIEYDGAHKVVVTVYEKAMAGCIEYMDQYIYFDRDGYVLEISLTKLEDIPCITGMSFDSMELHEKLPIEDKKRFKIILTLTQLIQKYDVHIDSIRFTSDGEVVLQYEDIKIELGDGSNIEEQLIDLDRMLELLKGKKGTLDLKNFDTATGTASFRLDSENTVSTPTGESDNMEDGTDKGDGSSLENPTDASSQVSSEATSEMPLETTQETPLEPSSEEPVATP